MIVAATGITAAAVAVAAVTKGMGATAVSAVAVGDLSRLRSQHSVSGRPEETVVLEAEAEEVPTICFQEAPARAAPLEEMEAIVMVFPLMAMEAVAALWAEPYL